MLTCDIETGRCTDDVIRRYVANWKPPGNCTNSDTIKAKREEFEKVAPEKSALWPESPITTVGLYNPSYLPTVIMVGTPSQIPNTLIVGANDEAELLKSVKSLTEWMTPEDVVTGWNIPFDLRKLRVAYARNGIAPPDWLAVGPGLTDQPIYDLMKAWERYWGAPFTKLEHAAEILGIPHHKKVVDGSQAPDLHAKGDFDSLALYSLNDILLEYKVYEIMTRGAGL